jgi:CRP-like cAMP-binding protein
MTAERPPDLTDALREHPELAASWQLRRFEAGEEVFARGDPADALYLVESGEVEVYSPDKRGRRIALARLGPGQSFGELALVDRGGRTASVRCVQASDLRVLYRDAFLTGLRRSPELAETTLFLLTARMRRTLSYLEYLTQWARWVADGRYDAADEAIGRAAAEQDDADIERFVETFRAMVAAVRSREAALERELTQLRIEVDAARREEQVAEITESDFFRRLERRAREVRTGRRSGTTAGHDSEIEPTGSPGPAAPTSGAPGPAGS